MKKGRRDGLCHTFLFKNNNKKKDRNIRYSELESNNQGQILTVLRPILSDGHDELAQSELAISTVL